MTAAVQPPTPEQPVDESGPAAGDRPAKPARATKPDRATMALLLVAAFVAVGGIGFALGHLTAPTGTGSRAANPTFGRGFGGARPSLAPGQTFAPGGGTGSGFGGVGGVSGTVQSIDGSTMTVQLANGTTVIIDLTGSTTYHSETSASAGDVKVGSSVIVQIDASAGASPAPGASGGRTLSAKDVLVTNP
jgi:hypothetical protein